MSQWTPKRFRPIHLQILRLWAQGLSNLEIAASVGYTPQQVCNIVTSAGADELLQQMTENTLDTIADVQTQAQAIAPLVFEEKVRLALQAKDERVRSSSCTEILDRAGHMPVRHIKVEKVEEEVNPWEGKTEDEIRKELLDILSKSPESATVH